jgi:peptidoglycan/xylan/chitin deacetylase (PgdA/CDA1 family)
MSDHYEIVDLAEALENTTTERKRIAITFDDALENVYQNAVPILKKFDAPATVFVVADYIPDGTIKEDNEYMDLTQLRSLVDDDLFAIGNHTKSHPHLERLAKQSAIEREIVQAKNDLEDQLETDIDRFSYPYGSYTAHVSDVVADTHELATTTESRLLGESPERTQIPRLDAKYDFSRLRWELSDASEMVKSAAHRLGVIESVDF